MKRKYCMRHYAPYRIKISFLFPKKPAEIKRQGTTFTQNKMDQSEIVQVWGKFPHDGKMPQDVPGNRAGNEIESYSICGSS